MLIDLVLVSLLSTLLSLPFLRNTDRMRLSGGLLNGSFCSHVTQLPQETLDLVKANVQAATVCRTSVYGLDNGLVLTMVFDRVETAHASSHKTVTLKISEKGLVVWPFAPDALVSLMLMGLGLPLCLLRWGKTPGKHIMGVILSRPITFRHAVLRESVRLWPPHLSNLSAVALPLYGHHQVDWLNRFGITVILAPIGLAALLFLATHVVPLLRWRGRMPWDGLVGAEVRRRRDLPF